MSSVPEWLKVSGIGVIIALMCYQVFQPPKPLVTSGTLPIEAPRSSSAEDVDKAKQDLMRIVENPLRSNFKFPDSVKVRWLKIDQRKILSQAGLKVSRENEIEEWRMCGVYSAPTPMGLYGPFENIYAKVAVDRGKNQLDGGVFFQHDGDWSLMAFLTLPYPEKVDEKKVDDAGIEFCNGVNSVDMGEFKGYNIGYYVDNLYDDMVKRIVDKKETDDYNKCLTGGNSFHDCLSYYNCFTNPEKEKECSNGFNICTPSDTVKQCVDKLHVEFKRLYEEDKKKKEAEKKNR